MSDGTRPRVSVVTIAYNDRAGLEATVASTAAQDWESVEHIVVDAGSSDGTVDYLRALGERVKWTSEPDKGRYDGMNKGVARSTGEWLWFMNSGDTFARPDSVRTAIEALARHPERRWGYGLSRIGDVDSCIGIGGSVPFSLPRFLLGGHPIPHQAVFISRELHDDIGGYSIDFGLAADQTYLMAAALRAEPLVLADVLCHFDKGGAGSTRSMRHHFQDMARSRKVNGATVTGLARLDDVLSFTVAVQKKVERGQRTVLRSAGVRRRAEAMRHG